MSLCVPPQGRWESRRFMPPLVTEEDNSRHPTDAFPCDSDSGSGGQDQRDHHSRGDSERCTHRCSHRQASWSVSQPGQPCLNIVCARSQRARWCGITRKSSKRVAKRSRADPAAGAVIGAQLRIQAHQGHRRTKGRKDWREGSEERATRDQRRVVPLAKVRMLVGQNGIELVGAESGEQATREHDSMASAADAEGVRCVVLDDQGTCRGIRSSDHVKCCDTRGALPAV